jgi:hypothetical protein
VADHRRYATVPYPWRAAVGLTSPGPGRFFESLVEQTLRYGMPGTRRLGGLWALAGRRGLPRGAVRAAIRLCPRARRPDLDAMRDEVVRAWPALAARLGHLAPDPPPLSLLALRRRAALTIFLFGTAPEPLLVLKLPAPGNSSPELEAAALREAEPAAIAPRDLGRAGAALVQEAIPGTPLEVEPLAPSDAAGLRWPEPLAELTAGLARLAGMTAKGEEPQQLLEPIHRALAYDRLSTGTRRLVAAAARDVARLDRSVLAHRDASPQNVLFLNGSLSGLVDWELASSRGVPGFDAWNAALAFLETGVALRRWSGSRVEHAFQRAWKESVFYAEARTAARGAAQAADVPDRLLDPLELAFFARRLGHRVDRPTQFPTGPATAAFMLEQVSRN